jgi:hypothetical protein
LSVDQAFKLLVQGSPIELLALFIIAAYLQMIVLGPFYKALLKDRDDWKAIAQSATQTLKEQTDQIGKLTDITETLSQGRRPH